MSAQVVCITGAAGFVGRYLIEELQKYPEQWSVIACDKDVGALPDSVEKVEIDITDANSYKSLFQERKPAWVVHLAAVSSVAFAIDHADLTRTINVFGTKSLLNTLKEVSPATTCLVISSADVYGHVGAEPIVELPLSECRPTNPYGQSKLEMEQIIEDEFNAMCVRVRPFPHIGPGQRQGFVTADFASQIARIERGEQESVMSVGNLEAIRDFTDVRDVVRAYRRIMEAGVVGEVYHVASGVGTKIQTILDQLLALSSADIRVMQDEKRMRPADNPVIVGNSDKVSSLTHWKPEIPLHSSLSDILDYWRNNT